MPFTCGTNNVGIGTCGTNNVGIGYEFFYLALCKSNNALKATIIISCEHECEQRAPFYQNQYAGVSINDTRAIGNATSLTERACML